MRCLANLFFVVTIEFIFVSGEHIHSLIWSKTFSYEAILNIPNAGVVQPYKVWVDGSTGNTRVDYYDGLDKFYRVRMYGSKTTFNFFKVHPQVIDAGLHSENVCHKIQAGGIVKMYSLNIYMPWNTFIYVGPDTISDTDCQKWAYTKSYRMFGYDILYTYTVWVIQEKIGDEILSKLVKYDFKASVGDIIIDEFNHIYMNFTFGPIDADKFVIPNVESCKDYLLADEEPIDSLIDFIHPTVAFSRINKSFESFKSQHNKKYTNDTEHFMRMNVFLNNLRYINAENKRQHSYTLAVNHLADYTDDEIAVFLGTSINTSPDNKNDDDASVQEIVKVTDNRHKHFDWRKYNAITPIKDQTSLCGSCYAFATAAAVETSLYIQKGFRKLIAVSEQAIIDCSWGVKNEGCNGGSINSSLSWVESYGVPYKKEYGPYLAMEGLCHHSAMSQLGFIKGYKRLGRDISGIKKAILKKGPVIVAIDSTPKSFTFYSSGIYNDEQCNRSPLSRNHGLVIIGYGSSNGDEYWILKNSFGTTWGENGYMKIAIENNICGVTNYVYSVDASA